MLALGVAALLVPVVVYANQPAANVPPTKGGLHLGQRLSDALDARETQLNAFVAGVTPTRQFVDTDVIYSAGPLEPGRVLWATYYVIGDEEDGFGGSYALGLSQKTVNEFGGIRFAAGLYELANDTYPPNGLYAVMICLRDFPSAVGAVAVAPDGTEMCTPELDPYSDLPVD